MHILVLPAWYPEFQGDYGGSFFREQAVALAARGHHLGVVFVKSLPPVAVFEFTRLLFSREELDEGVRTLRSAYFLTRFNRRWVSYYWWRIIKRYVRRYGKPDVIHAHCMTPAGLAAGYAAKRLGVPFVVTEHRSFARSDFDGGDTESLVKKTASEAAALIAVSPQFSVTLDKMYGFARWRSVPNLLPSEFERSGVTPTANEVVVFGHVSSLVPLKRVDLLIEAFARAFGNQPDVQLRIVGESPLIGEYRELASSLGLSNAVFLGNIKRHEVISEFHKFDVFVAPSDSETFGVVYWEAMACGLPIIATETAGGKNAVDSDTGYLVPVGDLSALSAALLKMRENYRSFDRAFIRSRAVEVCGSEAFVSSYEKVYGDAISSELNRKG